ncbi:MAG: FtsQ-type POTRA domain-containing protein [Actinomycetota bacterium]
MMPDVEPVTDIGEVDAAPDVAKLTDAVKSESKAPESSPTLAVEAETTPADQPPSLEPASAGGRRDRFRKVGAIAFIATVLLVAAAVTLTRSPFFYAGTIDVRGTSHVARVDVLRIAAITSKTNVFTLDTEAAEARLERESWIAEATITKDLPSRLIIEIDERVAVAVAQSGGVLRLVADDGVLLEAALPRAATGLPVIAPADEPGLEPTADAVEGAARAIDAMAPTLRHRIDGVSILADGQLRVDLSSGAEVAYGEAVDLPDKAMALRALLDYAAENGTSVISADVRVPSAPTAVLSGGVVVAP